MAFTDIGNNCIVEDGEVIYFYPIDRYYTESRKIVYFNDYQRLKKAFYNITSPFVVFPCYYLHYGSSSLENFMWIDALTVLFDNRYDGSSELSLIANRKLAARKAGIKRAIAGHNMYLELKEKRACI